MRNLSRPPRRTSRPHGGRPQDSPQFESSKAEQEQIRRELLELGRTFPHTQDIREILFHPAFPVDIRHNAKIFREKLALWAEDSL